MGTRLKNQSSLYNTGAWNGQITLLYPLSGEFSHNMLILKWKTETKKFKTQDVNDKGYSRYLKVSKNMKKPKLRFFTKLEVISFIKLVDYENSCARSFFNEAFRREGQYNSNWVFWYFMSKYIGENKLQGNVSQ